MKTAPVDIGTKDVVATVLVAAIVVPYLGYLALGGMPFVQDPRGMAVIGLVLGAIASAVIGREGFARRPSGRAARALGGGAAVLGLVTFVWAEEGIPSEILLAVFIVLVVATWALSVAVGRSAPRRTAPR